MDKDEEIEITKQQPVNSVKCQDCGKHIEWNIAHGFAAVEQMRAADVDYCNCPDYLPNFILGTQDWCLKCDRPHAPNANR